MGQPCAASRATYDAASPFRSTLTSVLCLVLTLASGCRTSEDLLLREAGNLLAGKDYGKARETLTRLIELNPDSPQGLFCRGLAAWELDDFESAEKDVTAAIRLRPEIREYRWTRFRMLQSRYRALQSGATSQIELPVRGTLLVALNTLMRRDLEMILRLDPYDIPARMELASVLESSGAPEEAIAELSVCILNLPFDAELRIERGRLLHDVGKFEEAIEDYGMAIRWGESGTLAKFNLALSLERLGRREEAVLALQEVVCEDSLDAEAWYILGKLQHGLGRHAAGCSSLQCSRSLGNAEARELYEELCR